MATISSPFSTFITCQPIEPKRAATFSVKAISVDPSIVMRLLSYMAISLFSFCVPARLAASYDAPSIMQPSPIRTYV